MKMRRFGDGGCGFASDRARVFCFAVWVVHGVAFCLVLFGLGSFVIFIIGTCSPTDRVFDGLIIFQAGVEFCQDFLL